MKPDEPCNIKISFCHKSHGDGFDFDGEGGTLARGYFPGSGIGGDLHFDDMEKWIEKETQPGYNLFVVAVHEIGHCLGLNHSDNPVSVMFPSYKHESSKVPKKDILSKYDIERIQKVYGKPQIKIFEGIGLTIKVKPIENNKIKLIIEKSNVTRI